MVVPPTERAPRFALAWDDVISDKATLRRDYRAKRDAFVAERSDREMAIAFSRAPSPLVKLLTPGKTVAGYIAKGSEADPARLLAEAHRLGCVTALPLVTGQAAPMLFKLWSPGDVLAAGPFGLMQPLETAQDVMPDVLLVPLVAFDSALMRLGQGAGHYDRALSVLTASIAIGLAWSVQQAPVIAADAWDIPMDAVLTEQSWKTL